MLTHISFFPEGMDLRLFLPACLVVSVVVLLAEGTKHDIVVILIVTDIYMITSVKST